MLTAYAGVRLGIPIFPERTSSVWPRAPVVAVRKDHGSQLHCVSWNLRHALLDYHMKSTKLTYVHPLMTSCRWAESRGSHSWCGKSSNNFMVRRWTCYFFPLKLRGMGVVCHACYRPNNVGYGNFHATPCPSYSYQKAGWSAVQIAVDTCMCFHV